MKKHWYLSLMAFALHSSSSANFSIRFNVGMTSIGHETKASLIETFNELSAYETLDNFRGADTTDATYFQKVSNRHAYVVRMQQMFIDEDKTGKAWENTTTTTYLTPLLIASDNTSARLASTTLLTGTDTNGATTNFSIPSAGKVSADNGLEFSLSSEKAYTNISNTLDSNWEDQYGYIVSTDSFDKIKSFKDEIVTSISTKANTLTSQKHYNTIDSGLLLSYDFGQLHVYSTLTFHYPVDLNPRETLSLVKFSPNSTLEGSLGALVNYRHGKIGGAIGISQVRGNFILQKYQRKTSNNGNLSLKYVDYTNSYTDGNDNLTLKDVHESFYYAEVRAETMPTYLGGTTVYGSYKIGFGEQGADGVLAKLNLKQDSVTVGLSFAFIDNKI